MYVWSLKLIFLCAALQFDAEGGSHGSIDDVLRWLIVLLFSGSYSSPKEISTYHEFMSIYKIPLFCIEVKKNFIFFLWLYRSWFFVVWLWILSVSPPRDRHPIPIPRIPPIPHTLHIPIPSLLFSLQSKAT